jgi:DNA-binding transcriptional LysR family regulator
MDKFAALHAYVTVVEADGFAAAARVLGQSRSAVNRLVITLENELGVQLLNRTTRRVSPTANGTAFYDRAKAILAALDEAERDLAESHEAAVGRLRVNAPMSFGVMHLGRAVADFMARHPDLTIELNLNDRFVDIIEEGFDLAIRIAEPQEESTLVDFRICAAKRALCAAPEYLAAHGTPQHPSELRQHRCLHYGNLSTGGLWRLNGPEGSIGVHIDPAMVSNNGQVLCDAAVRGLGIILSPSFISGPDLQAGRLVTILPDYRPPEVILSAIYPPTRHLSAKIRLFTDFLVDRFGDRPYWDLVE